MVPRVVQSTLVDSTGDGLSDASMIMADAPDPELVVPIPWNVRLTHHGEYLSPATVVVASVSN
jgi:hypothetical protein